MVGIALLVVSPSYAYEGAYRSIRDGAVHHESAAAAATHQTSGIAGDQGHEDGLPASQHQNGPRHQHGTPADHCTHVHFASVAMPTAIAFAGLVLTQAAREAVPFESWLSLSEFRPPRA